MVTIAQSTCDRCGTCIAVCPCDAIRLDRFLSVDCSLCILCGRCVKVCPVGALSISAEA